MGFKICWIAFQDLRKDQILDHIGFLDSGEADPANEAPFSGVEIPAGWFIVFVNQYGFVTPDRLASWSIQSRIIACQIHEGIMASEAYGYRQGQHIWHVEHEAYKGIGHLLVEGSPPPAFEAIEKQERLRQATGPKFESFKIDCIFEIPVATAFAECGYRHDRYRFEWGEPQFTRLEARQNGSVDGGR